MATTRTFEIYEVPNEYPIWGTGPGGSDPTILDIGQMTVVDDNSALQADPATAGAGQVISFNGVQVDDFSFLWDDTITLNGATVTVKTFTLTIGGTTRSFIMSDTANSIPGASIGDSFQLTSYTNYTDLVYSSVACFAAGTLIETARGPRPVESLRPGDMVLTLDAGLQPVRWVGRTRLGPRQLLKAPHLKPVRVPAGAFGPGRPSRDLVVSPQHRLLLEGPALELHFGFDQALAAATALVGRRGIHVAGDLRHVEYVHLMFDRHQVIWSEGLPSESFLVGDTIRDGLDAALLAEILELFPELADRESRPAVARPARPVLKRYEVRALGEAGLCAGSGAGAGAAIAPVPATA